MEKNNKMYNKVKEYINNLDINEIIELHNRYYNMVPFQKEVYFMDDFNEIMCDVCPLDVAMTVYDSQNFCPSDDYFFFDSRYIFESFNCLEDPNPININNIIEYIIDNKTDLGDSEINKIINK